MAGRPRWHALVFSFAALVAEALALSLVQADQLAWAVLCHVLAAMLVGAAALPPASEARGRLLASSLGAWSLCVPVLAPLGLCLVLLPALAQRRSHGPKRMLEIEPSGPERNDRELFSGLSCAELFAGTASEAQRIAALMRLRKCELAWAVPLLRAALSDRYEDVRLLAFALLEKHEKQLRANIERATCALASLRPGHAAADGGAVSERLCHAHWCLARSGFVSGAALAVTLREAARHGAAALEVVEHAALAQLLARIHLRLREGPAALHYLSSCARAGAATSVLAPLYAEAAFLTEQYRAVPGLLALGDPVGLAVPELRRLRAFWEGRDRP